MTLINMHSPNGTDTVCTRFRYRLFRIYEMIVQTRGLENHPNSSCPSLPDTECGSGLGIHEYVHIGVVAIVQFAIVSHNHRYVCIGS